MTSSLFGKGRVRSNLCCNFFSSFESVRMVPLWATLPFRTSFILCSVIAASCKMGQYLLTWTIHLICHLAASVLLSSKVEPPGAQIETGLFGVVMVQSSPPSPSAGASFSLENFFAIFLSCTTLVTAVPTSLDNPAIISLHTRPASLHPSSFIVMPICRGVLDDETGSTRRWWQKARLRWCWWCKWEIWWYANERYGDMHKIDGDPRLPCPSSFLRCRYLYPETWARGDGLSQLPPVDLAQLSTWAPHRQPQDHYSQKLWRQHQHRPCLLQVQYFQMTVKLTSNFSFCWCSLWLHMSCCSDYWLVAVVGRTTAVENWRWHWMCWRYSKCFSSMSCDWEAITKDNQVCCLWFDVPTSLTIWAYQPVAYTTATQKS